MHLGLVSFASYLWQAEVVALWQTGTQGSEKGGAAFQIYIFDFASMFCFHSVCSHKAQQKSPNNIFIL